MRGLSLEQLDHFFLVPNLLYLLGELRVEAISEPVVYVIFLVAYIDGEFFRCELFNSAVIAVLVSM
jgi:hypothetical protein